MFRRLSDPCYLCSQEEAVAESSYMVPMCAHCSKLLKPVSIEEKFKEEEKTPVYPFKNPYDEGPSWSET